MQNNRQYILISFTCSCGYSEPIGVDPNCGIIFEGTLTIICPRCGHISRNERVTTITPVRLLRP
jgi:hypothetical protein